MLPFVSVILPIRNESAYIERALSSVLKQEYPPEKFEILIVDGMSTDNTREIIKRLVEKFPNHDVNILDNPDKIVPTGLNIALRQAKGEIIIRVDGHCEIAPDYIRKCIENLIENQADGVGGPIQTVGETDLAQTIAKAMSSRFGVGNSAFRIIKDQTLQVDSIAFPAYTRTAIEKAGLFDEELVRNQDDEYNYRLRKLGAKIILTPDIQSRYFSRSSLKSLWRQYFQYGFWKVRVLQKHPGQMSFRQFLPPIFVISLVGAALVSFFNPTAIYWLFYLIGLYIIVNLIASISLSFRNSIKQLYCLPFVFGILHTSYGLGFLVGLIRFWNRWGDKDGLVPEV